jgi:hypothetical protein
VGNVNPIVADPHEGIEGLNMGELIFGEVIAGGRVVTTGAAHYLAADGIIVGGSNSGDDICGGKCGCE